MVDVRGDVLRPPHGTTPAAVKSNIKSEMRSFKSNENILSLWLKLNYTLTNVMAKWNKTFPWKLKWSVSGRSLALSHVYNQSYIIFILQYMVTGEVGLLCLAVLNLVAEVHNTVSECAIIRIRNTVATGVREMQKNIIDVMKSLA